jgi:ferredoxin
MVLFVLCRKNRKKVPYGLYVRAKNDNFARDSLKFVHMTPREDIITRREALRRLLAGGALLAGASLGLSSCFGGSSEQDAAAPKAGPGAAAAGQKIACVGCGLCMPCPYGVDIPGNFSVYNDAVSLGELPDPREASRPGFREQRLRFLSDYHERLNHLERADHCIGCGRCAAACPQQLDVPRLLQQIASLVEGLHGR